MGGFTINGCGAADSFYPIKDLGEFYCSECRQKRQMCLMEVKRKIKVLYIPTVSINTKYAVGCRSCENGYYISDQQKDDLIYGRAWPEITEDGLLLHQIKESPAQGTEMTAEEYLEEEETETASEEYADMPDTMQQSGPAGGGKDFSVKAALAGTLQRKICPVCGLLYTADKINCSVCGKQLEERK